jgi:hypothetical protein
MDTKPLLPYVCVCVCVDFLNCSSLFGLRSQPYKSLRDDEHVDIISVVDHWILLASVRWGGARVWRSKAVLVRYLHFSCILILQ